jgi:hypothetical protein|tara:strand:- start:21964 stop:22461 length:498 start_codon:yes stop_codon:yes gene_type:complete
MTLLGSVTVNLIVLVAAWMRFKTTLASTTSEIKNHADMSIQKLNGMLTYVIHSFDRPAWIKVARHEHGEVVFRMLELNQHFGDEYGIYRSDYIGKTDLEAGWDHKTAKIMFEHDLAVWASGEPTTFIERIEGVERHFRKIRITTPDGKLKGIMSYEIDTPRASLY